MKQKPLKPKRSLPSEPEEQHYASLLPREELPPETSAALRRNVNAASARDSVSARIARLSGAYVNMTQENNSHQYANLGRIENAAVFLI